jgi:hypothetical protein
VLIWQGLLIGLICAVILFGSVRLWERRKTGSGGGADRRADTA